MHRSHLRLRPIAALSAVLLAAVAQLPGLAAAADASSAPEVVFATPSVTGSSVTLTFTANRATNAIDAAACTLTDASDVVTEVDCGTSAAGSVRRSTDYTGTLTDLAAGDYVYAATVTLTDGGTATSTVPFTVEPVEPVAPVEFAASSAACSGLGGGNFVAHAYWWQVWSCEFDAATSEEGAAAAAGLATLCLGDGGIGFDGGIVAPGRYQASCWLT